MRYYNTFGANGLLSRWCRNSGGATSVTRFFLWDERGNLANRLDESQNGGIHTRPLPKTIPPTASTASLPG